MQKKLAPIAIVFVLLTLAATASAQTSLFQPARLDWSGVLGVQAKAAPVAALKTCELGTAWALNPKRELGPKERWISDPGGPVLMSQRETPGSTHIVWRECILPPTEAAVGGLLPWAKPCGNDYIPKGRTLPGMEPIPGPPGPMGPRGFEGPPGRDGLSYDACLNLDGDQAFVPLGMVADSRDNCITRLPVEHHGWFTKKKALVIGAAIAGGYAAWYYWPCPPGTARR